MDTSAIVAVWFAFGFLLLAIRLPKTSDSYKLSLVAACLMAFVAIFLGCMFILHGLSEVILSIKSAQPVD